MAGLTPIYETYGQNDAESPLTEENFRAAESLQEGISGRRAIDSTYDAQSEGLVQKPRSGDMWPENDKDKPYRNWK
jgi:hypothetical protein